MSRVRLLSPAPQQRGRGLGAAGGHPQLGDPVAAPAYDDDTLAGPADDLAGALARLRSGDAPGSRRWRGERDRLAERITIALSQPSVLARAALSARRYAGHPYAISLPDPALVSDVTGAALG